MSKPKLALIPIGYKSGKVYSILPNDATGDFDFTRASGGTRVRKDGLIEEMQTYGENELLNSDFNTTDNWVINGATGTVIENGYARIFTTGAYTEIYQAGTSIVANELYRLDYEVISNDGGNLGVVAYSGQTQLLPSTVGKHSVEFLGNNTTLAIKRYSGATDIKIAYAKVYKINFNVPRLDWYNSNCPSLLLEPQRTNLQVESEQFSNSSIWSRARGTAIADQQIAPNGEYTADKITGDGTGTTYFYDGISFTSGLEYAISIFVKPINVTTFVIQNFTEFGTATFDIQNGTLSGVSGSLISQNIQNYGNGWYRCSAIYDCTSTGSKNIGYGIQNFNGDQFYLWGAQVEQGSYPTSYIKTEASTVTRLKDECLNGGDSDLFDITEGTIFVDVTPYKSSSSFTAIGLSNGSNTNRLELLFYGSSNQVRTILQGGASASVDNYESITYNTRNKIAVSFKSNECKIYINGTLEFTDLTVDTLSSLDQFEFNLFNGTLNFEGKVHDTRVYDRVLTEAEAIELTTI